MRLLYYVVIIHEKEDFGHLKEAYEHHLKMFRGPTDAPIFQRQVQQYWGLIREEIKAIPFDYANVQIYWDSLIVGLENIILEHSIKHAKTSDTLIIQELISKGAKLVGTEDGDLVRAQLTIAKRILLEKNPTRRLQLWRQYRPESQRLTRSRNEFIVTKINETLRVQGIIFLGALHQIQTALAEDIVVRQIPSHVKVIISPNQDRVEIIFQGAPY